MQLHTSFEVINIHINSSYTDRKIIVIETKQNGKQFLDLHLNEDEAKFLQHNLGKVLDILSAETKKSNETIP